MPIIDSHLNLTDPCFAENAAHNRALAQELHAAREQLLSDRFRTSTDWSRTTAFPSLSPNSNTLKLPSPNPSPSSTVAPITLGLGSSRRPARLLFSIIQLPKPTSSISPQLFYRY